jgi:hypothetical protein
MAVAYANAYAKGLDGHKINLSPSIRCGVEALEPM